MDILKNPIIISVIVGTLTYYYLVWNKSKKDEENKKPVGLFTPLVVTIITWLIVFGLQQYGLEALQPEEKISYGGGNDIFNTVDTVSSLNPQNLSDSVNSFQLIGTSIGLPNKLEVPSLSSGNMPDVFID